MMTNNSSYFQINFKGYIKGNSYIHSLDARIKIFSVIIVLIETIISNNPISLLVLMFFVLVLVRFSGLKYSYILSPLPPLIPFILIAVVFRLFTHTKGWSNNEIIIRLRYFFVTYSSLKSALVLIIRFFILFVIITLFSSTTKLEDFTRGFERILNPLQKLGIPAHEFSMVVNISVSFFHVLIVEVNRIIKAQVSRGADFESGKLNIFKKVKNIMPLIVPLFIFSLDHSKSLVEAMESRCYRGGKGRSYYFTLKYDISDFLFLGLIIMVVGIANLTGHFLTNTDFIKELLTL